MLRGSLTRTVRWSSRVGWWKVAGGIALIGIAGGAYIALHPAQGVIQVLSGIRSVEVRSVSDLSAESVPLSVVGAVHSQSEATVRAEKSGQVTAVYHALGDTVQAGAIVVEIENASERAALVQAEGARDAAQASLDKVKGGARSEQRSILEANIRAAQAALDASRGGAINTLLSAYATLDNAIHGTTDKMFTNPDGLIPHFNVMSPDSQLTINIENTRGVVGQYLKREASVSDSLTASSNLQAEITTTQGELRSTRSFLDMIISALNKGFTTTTITSTVLATYVTDATAARTALTTSLSSLASAQEALSSKQAGLEVAQKNLEQGVAGGQTEDIAGAAAALKQAEGTVAAARANLEKAIIRAPITGTINSFSQNRGDYLIVSTPVLSVANNHALEIIAYVTESDAHEIMVGSGVAIEGGVRGTITRIAPALDPITKKIEVRIGVTGAGSGLVNGQSVTLGINRTNPVPTVGVPVRITIPISALKVGADDMSVFTVDVSNMLVAHMVTIGALLGDHVEIKSGLTSDMRIVVDARGLRAGEIVAVK